MDVAVSHKLLRRSVSISAVCLALIVLSPLIVLLSPAIIAFDLLRGRPSLPTGRVLLFALTYVGWEVVAVLSAGTLWLLTGFGRAQNRPWSIAAHRSLQRTWVSSLLATAHRLLNLRTEITGADALDDSAESSNGGEAPLIVLSRHASMVDTLIPAKLLFDRGYNVRYVLKDELRWDPALDIIGDRLPNYFVNRSNPDGAHELRGIEQLAATAGRREALVIFPEGSRWSAEKQRRAVQRLSDNGSPAASRAERLRHTLPVRPGGSLALLRGAPGADVIVFSHTGLEGLAGPKDAFRLLPFRKPVIVDIRRVPRDEVPSEIEAQRSWLMDEWQVVDDWVDTHRQP